MAPNPPKGRMSLRRGAAANPQQPRIRLWTLPPDPPEGSTSERLLKHYERVFSNIDALDAKKQELARSQDLTEIGRQRQLLDHAFSSFMPNVLQARRTISKAQREVATKRSKLQKPKSDPVEKAARREIRDYLRGLSNEDRDAFLRKNGLLTGLDPEIRQAIIEMPAALSNVPQARYDELVREATAALNGPLLDDIAALEKAIEITASAIGEGQADIQSQAISCDPSYADQDVFEAKAKEAAKLQDQPWLKTFQENGGEVLKVFEFDPATNSGRWKMPSNEEIENGLICKDHDEYIKMKTAAPFASLAGTGDEAREARAAFVNEHGVGAYLARNKTAA
jgi:hypothetical protein